MAAKADVDPIEVLFALHPNFNLLDLTGPLEVLHTAQHDWSDACKWPQSVPVTPPFARGIGSKLTVGTCQ